MTRARDGAGSGKGGSGGAGAQRASDGPDLSRSPAASLPCVHQIRLPTPWEVDTVQVHLIESDPLTLIDCGVRSAASASALTSALESIGYGFEDLQRIVLTHYHRDHMGQAQFLREAADDLEVLVHEDDAFMVENFSVERDERIEDTKALLREFGAPAEVIDRVETSRQSRLRREPAVCEPTRVDRVLRDGDRVGFKDFELSVIHSPGHTPGHILLHEPESGVLFTGDQILGGAVPNTENHYLEGLPEPADPLRRRPRFKGLLRYRESMRWLRGERFSCILPGFGGVIRNPERAIRDALLFYEVRVQRIERSLRSVSALGQSVTAYELWHALFPNDDPAREMRTHLLMVIGALDVLESSGRCVTERREDGVLVHSYAQGD